MIKVLMFKRKNKLCGLNIDNYPEIDWNTEKGKRLLNMLYIATIAKDFEVTASEYQCNIEVRYTETYEDAEHAQDCLEQEALDNDTCYTWIE